MSEQVPDLRVVRNELEDLQRDFATLLMATVSAGGVPDASYAAYVERDGDYYVYISELSTHTRNLAANGLASVLFIENEAQAGHPFARRRLSYQCEAIEVARGSAEFESTLEVFAGRFGNLIATLRELQDFHLFRLRPLHGLYVAGFARAYVVDAVDRQRLSHVRDKGHRGSARAGPTSGDERE